MKMTEKQKEQNRERSRKWRQANPDRVKEGQKRYKEANPEKTREYQRKWVAANPGRVKEKCKKYYQDNSDKLKESMRKAQYAQYGITAAEFDSISIAQGKACVICGERERNGKRLSIDHDHSTGKFRGLLCHRCNVGLGMFRDSEDLLSMAISYLRERRK